MDTEISLKIVQVLAFIPLAALILPLAQNGDTWLKIQIGLLGFQIGCLVSFVIIAFIK